MSILPSFSSAAWRVASSSQALLRRRLANSSLMCPTISVISRRGGVRELGLHVQLRQGVVQLRADLLGDDALALRRYLQSLAQARELLLRGAVRPTEFGGPAGQDKPAQQQFHVVGRLLNQQPLQRLNGVDVGNLHAGGRA